MERRRELQKLYDGALAYIRAQGSRYRLMTLGERSARFRILGVADADATIEVREDSVVIRTESLYGLSPKHPVAKIMRDCLGSRKDIFTVVKDEDGLVFELEIGVSRGGLLANGQETRLRIGDLIEDLKAAIDLAHAYHHHFTAGI